MLSCREFDALQLKLKRAAPFPQWRPCWRYTADRPFSLLQCSESLSQRPTSTCSYLKGTGSHIWTICPVSFWTNIDRRHVFQNTGQMHAWLTTVEQLQAAIIHVQQSSSTQCGCSCSMLCDVWLVSNYLLPMCVYIPYVQQCISNHLKHACLKVLQPWWATLLELNKRCKHTYNALHMHVKTAVGIELNRL